MAQLGKIGAGEYRRILEDAHSHMGVKDWSFFLQNQFTMAADSLQSGFLALIDPFSRGVFLLALMSSMAPFLGLLGTVWGIMTSFQEIGLRGSASLAIVAPGISEALIATAAGLAVAIPAVIFYNYFSNWLTDIETTMQHFSDDFLNLVEREFISRVHGRRSEDRRSPEPPEA